MIHRHLRLICVLLALTTTTAPALAQPDGIDWQTDLDAALGASRESGVPVIAYFTFNGCVWCDRLEQDTFAVDEVIQRSRAFTWVKVNRDDTPEIPRRFNVSAYPALLTLGPDGENIHRFSGYALPDAFLPQLDESLRRHALFRAGKPWTPEPTRAASICDDAKVIVHAAPEPDEQPRGITIVDDEVWMLQGTTLYRIDRATNEVRRKVTLDIGGELFTDLAHDGEHLYAISYAWTAGGPIRVFNPDTGETIRDIKTASRANQRGHAGYGVAIANGRLFTLEPSAVHELDPKTGDILATHRPRPDARMTSLAALPDGSLVTSLGMSLMRFDPRDASRLDTTPLNYRVRSVAAADTALYLVEQPTFGFDEQHQRVRVWPKSMVMYELPR